MTTLTSTRRRRRPVWVPVVIVLAVVAVLFAAGFGIATWLQRDTSDVVTAEFGELPSTPEPCETSLVIPAEVLPSKDTVVLNVYNSTKRAGLAARVARDFKSEGFRINKVANDPRGERIEGVAEIRFGPNARLAAELVEYYLAGATMVELSRPGPRVDVSLGRGYTSLANGGAVAAVLATPQQVLTGPGCGDAVPVPLPTPETVDDAESLEPTE
jgi:hypothetical protein